jgi:hypothetical protein
MGKRSCTSNPSVVELEREEGVALRSSKRCVPQVASDTAAMSLLALRTELPTAFSDEVFPLNKPPFPLHPLRQPKAVKYSLSSITDDEDENEKNVVASKKRPNVFHVGPRTLTQSVLGKPILCIAGSRRREALLLSPGVIPPSNKS